MLSVAEKLYEMILETKLRQKLEKDMETSQSGFRKGHSTNDHIFTIKQIIEKMNTTKKEAFLCFVDLKKAFDMVSREYLWDLLEKRNIGDKLLRAIRGIYKVTRSYVRARGGESTKFTSYKGLRQGGSLSPFLFIIILDEVLKKIKPKQKKLHIGHKQLKPTYITEGSFADDLVIFAKTEADLQHNLELWKDELKTAGLELNLSKTKTMTIGNKNKTCHIKIEGVEIEHVSEYKYLGVIITQDGSAEIEIHNRLKAANKSFHALNKAILSNKLIKEETKITVYKSIYLPILIYGSETWVLNKNQQSKIQAAEMKFLRRARGVTKMDKIRSEQIRTDLKIKEARKSIEERKLNWWGHLKRMDEKKQVKKVWESRMDGKRKVGRPQVTWDQTIDRILTSKGVTKKEAASKTANREEWKKFTAK